MPPVHKIRASECGKARGGDLFAAAWSKVDCWACLQKAPPRPRRPAATEPRPCVEGDRCNEVGACRFCNRCKFHCVVKSPGADEEGHHAYFRNLKVPRPTSKRR